MQPFRIVKGNAELSQDFETRLLKWAGPEVTEARVVPHRAGRAESERVREAWVELVGAVEAAAGVELEVREVSGAGAAVEFREGWRGGPGGVHLARRTKPAHRGATSR
jgi:hypothetical protein